MVDWIIFKKPQRYIGNEWNVIKKDHYGKIKICLCYPDLYEVGMSNLGIRIIYALFNSFSNVVCERAFMPDQDFCDFLKRNKLTLFSLETKTPLSDFEVLGFNFNYELNYTNFLAMLSLGGIELKSAFRKDLIVLGGGVANPEGLAEFVDVFFLGEFEDMAFKFIDTLQRYKEKEERLRVLAEYEGFYVPKFYNFYLKGDKYIFEKKYRYAKLPIKRFYVKDMDKVYVPTNWLTPHTEIVHDRVQVEIARGCPNRCFFCQANRLYFPYRQRSVDCIIDIIKRTYDSSGYENFSLLALSASNYSNIEELIDKVSEYFGKDKIGISLPSLRIEDIVDNLYRSLTKLKKVSATFAIESATSRLRERINKNIDMKKLWETAKILRTLNLRHIKLYFMFGLPYEEDEDLIAMGRFVNEIRKESKLRINLSINTFIPKPFSHFQNMPIDKEEEIERKRKLILENMPKYGIRVSFSNPKRSVLEAIISRADRNLCKVILRAFNLGACFDSYPEKFNYRIWERAFIEENIDKYIYLNNKRDNFSWSYISIESDGEKNI
ncbi:MAG: TIGR03960 family B12-binding radical SAM protein [Candidatus Omnitrophica bacterium]|nr:TIGR03960 family B12-binding radical SAM protein [Candidatus Omnitrophota bacterium]